jgi:hypothetical protein
MFALVFLCQQRPCDVPALVKGVLITVEMTVSKPPIRRWPRFSKNCRTTGKEKH